MRAAEQGEVEQGQRNAQGGTGAELGAGQLTGLDDAERRPEHHRQSEQQDGRQAHIGGEQQGGDQGGEGQQQGRRRQPADERGDQPGREGSGGPHQRRPQTALLPGAAGEQTEGEQRRNRLRVGQRMEQAGIELAGTGDRRMRMGRRRQECQQRGPERPAASVQAPPGRRNQTPTTATRTPPARTACAPAGQRPSSPKAMPVRWMKPVASTKPTA